MTSVVDVCILCVQLVVISPSSSAVFPLVHLHNLFFVVQIPSLSRTLVVFERWGGVTRMRLTDITTVASNRNRARWLVVKSTILLTRHRCCCHRNISRKRRGEALLEPLICPRQQRLKGILEASSALRPLAVRLTNLSYW